MDSGDFMIDTKFIQEYARKNQTTQDNVCREYCQHLFLSQLYQQKGSEKILFKGGTALRVLWRSPRFSEDLDFTGISLSFSQMEDILADSLLTLEKEGLNITIQESKKTSGGYLGKLLFQWAQWSIPIQLEISMREKKNTKKFEQMLIHNDFIPPYLLSHLSEEELIREKIQALFQRSKPRDFFDLYFILRSHLAFKNVLRKNKMGKTEILKLLKKKDLNLTIELKQFLPVSYHSLLRNFPAMLEKELNRALP